MIDDQYDTRPAHGTSRGRRVAVRVWGWLAGVVGRHGIACLAILVGLTLNAAVLTDGKFDLMAKERWFTDFYDELGKSMLHGRFDIPAGTLQFEELQIGGHSYGYFGPTPALARIPLNLLFPLKHGRWARWLVLACCAASLGAFYSLMRQARRLLTGATEVGLAAQYADAALILAASVGTTLLAISKRAVVYHEAIAFGAAFALVSFALLARYLNGRGGLGSLLGAAVCALLSFLARESVGSGPLFALGVVGAGMAIVGASRKLRRARGRAVPGSDARGGLLSRACAVLAVPDNRRVGRHLVALAAVLAAGLAFTAYRNVRTVGNLLGVMPLDKHASYIHNANRLARTKGHFIQPANFRTAAHAYFRLHGLEMKRGFPWFSMPEKAPVFPGARYDAQEPLASLPAAYPFWTALLLVGLVALASPRIPDALAGMRLVVLSAALGFVPTMMAAGLTMRYLHDLFPFVAAGAAVGAQQLLVWHQRHRAVRIVMPVLVVLALATCATSTAVAVSIIR